MDAGRRSIRFIGFIGFIPALLAIVLAGAGWWMFLHDRAPGTDAALRGFPLDDAWIHMVYARSLAREGGLHYNDGVPEAGMTSPLWVVLLAGIHSLTGNGPVERIVLGAKILALLFGIGGTLALYALSRALGESRGIALLASALLAVDPSLTFSRAAGMEVPLFVLLVLLALLAAMKGRPLATGAAFGLSVVTRPEGVVLLPLLITLHLRGRSKKQPVGIGEMIGGAALAVLPALAYVVFCFFATGSPLPNTFYAKFVGRDPVSIRLLSFGWKHYIHDNLPYFTLQAGTVLCVLGVIRLARRGVRGIASVLAGAFLFAGTMGSRQIAPGHYYYWERWLIPAFPFLLLTIACGVGELWEGLPSLVGLAKRKKKARAGNKRVAGPIRSLAARVAAIGAIALAVGGLPSALRERAAAFAWNSQNIEEMNVALGHWVAAKLPGNAVVGVNDAGALRYFGMRRTVDLNGLNEHRLLHQDRDGFFRTFRDLGVDYVVVFPWWFKDIEASIPMHLLYQLGSPHYTICDAPQDVMLVGKLESH